MRILKNGLLFVRVAGSVALAATLALNNGVALAETATVRVGIANTSSDVGFFIADKKGYFKQEGLNVVFTPFNSAAKMVAPLGAGQLDVGGGTVSAGLYNGIARGINVRIVADKGSIPPGYGYSAVLVRKDLIDNGKFKSFADLKGLKVAVGAEGTGTASALNEALKKGGLKYSDVQVVTLGFPQHLMALGNKAIEASMTNEPTVTQAVNEGVAVRFATNDTFYPNQQVAVVLYSDGFIKGNPIVARKFMHAYVRAVRDYNDALKDGKLAGANATEVISILAEYTQIKDPAVYRAITPNGCNPDGHVNMASLEKDFQFFKEQGLIEGNVSVGQAVDRSFVEAALKDLGPYVRRSK
jgi:NitT/TauT family transport system substrate-binding protein